MPSAPGDPGGHQPNSWPPRQAEPPQGNCWRAKRTRRMGWGAAALGLLRSGGEREVARNRCLLMLDINLSDSWGAAGASWGGQGDESR